MFFEIKKKGEGERRKVRILIKKTSEDNGERCFFKLKKRRGNKEKGAYSN